MPPHAVRCGAAQARPAAVRQAGQQGSSVGVSKVEDEASTTLPCLALAYDDKAWWSPR
jgi:hypothetical protein